MTDSRIVHDVGHTHMWCAHCVIEAPNWSSLCLCDENIIIDHSRHLEHQQVVCLRNTGEIVVPSNACSGATEPTVEPDHISQDPGRWTIQQETNGGFCQIHEQKDCSWRTGFWNGGEFYPRREICLQLLAPPPVHLYRRPDADHHGSLFWDICQHGQIPVPCLNHLRYLVGFPVLHQDGPHCHSSTSGTRTEVVQTGHGSPGPHHLLDVATTHSGLQEAREAISTAYRTGQHPASPVSDPWLFYFAIGYKTFLV